MLKLKHNFPRSIRFLLIGTLVSVSIVIAALMTIGRVSSADRHESALVLPSQQRVQVVRFTLYDVGIYPQEARANPGRVTIAIEDLTRSSTGLVIERVEENARVPVRVDGKAKDLMRSRSELVLPAGRYEVADAARPANRALLIIEP
jgi:hypothetical protein